MSYNTTEHPDWPYDELGEPCTKCDSDNTFDCFDGVRVCRNCTFSERIELRPVNLITHEMKWKHERDEKMKRKVEAHGEAVDIQNMVKSIFNIPT